MAVIGHCTQRTGTINDVLAALTAQGHEVLRGKGGGFWIKGEGHVSTAQARRRTGIAAPRRERRAEKAPWGDFAVIAALNGIQSERPIPGGSR